MLPLLTACVVAPQRRAVDCIPVNDGFLVPLEDGLLTTNEACPDSSANGALEFEAIAHSLVRMAYGEDRVFANVAHHAGPEGSYWQANSPAQTFADGAQLPAVVVNSRPLPLDWKDAGCTFYAFRPASPR